MKSMMQHSVGPGIAPRSWSFQSAKISSIHGVPMNSNAKYSIRWLAAPSNTVFLAKEMNRIFVTRKMTFYVKQIFQERKKSFN